MMKFLFKGKLLTISFLCVLFFSPKIAFCEIYNNGSFLELDLPPGWKCNLKNSEWICQNSDASKKKEASIIFLAKLKKDDDSMDQYFSYLNSKKNYTTLKDKSVTSDLKFSNKLKINDHEWINSLYTESFGSGYYTRYLATIKNDIGVLVLFSVMSKKYPEYSLLFDQVVKSLKVNNRAGQASTVAQATKVPQNNIEISNNTGKLTIFPEGKVQGGSDQVQVAQNDNNKSIAGLIVVVAAVACFLIWKRRKNSSNE